MLDAPWLRRRAAITPKRVAVEVGGVRLDFAELEARASALAAALYARDVRSGDIVAAALGNGLPFLELLHAVDRCGATLLPVNVRLAPRELAFQLGDSATRLLLHADDELAEVARATAAMAPGIEIASLTAILEAGGEAPEDASPLHSAPIRIDPSAPFAILYTSGTTGRPKGACLSRDNFLWSAVSSAFHIGAHPDDRWLACLPLFHVGGVSILLRSVLYGSAVSIHERFDPARVSRALDADAITHVSLTATMLQRLLDARGSQPAPRQLRCALLGGGPCPDALLERARALDFPIARTYGLTEAASQVATQPPSREVRHADVNEPLTPLLGTQLRIVDASGTDLASGGEGEIWVRSPTVMSGYVRDPSPADTALHNGWLRTGDIGSLDAAGRLRVLDRRSDLIVSGGANIYPAEVEAALIEHPAVAEVGVAGIEDAEYGRRPAAWWIAKPGTPAPSEPALRAFCRERLASYKVPVVFHRVEALPRNSAGKLLRQQLASEVRADGIGSR
jgi:O-succinylbenzoic acid--CoA ligase